MKLIAQRQAEGNGKFLTLFSAGFLRHRMETGVTHGLC